MMPDGTAVLAAGHPAVRPLVLESLRHWAEEYQLDGFSLVNAENLVQVGAVRARRTVEGWWSAARGPAPHPHLAQAHGIHVCIL